MSSERRLSSTIPLPEMPTVRPDIISSIAEVDFYKFKMLYFIWKNFVRTGKTPDVEFTFQQRGDFTMATFNEFPRIIRVEEIQAAIEHVKTLRMNEEILQGLHQSGQFTEYEEEFFSYLRTKFRLSPHVHVGVSSDGKKFDIRAHGSWDQVSFWETMIMDIIAELRTAKFLNGDKKKWAEMVATNNKNLLESLELMLAYPDLVLALFGLRRRASSGIEEYNTRQFIEVLAQSGKFKQLMGIANTSLGIKLNNMYPQELNLRLMGTYAHELPMVYSGLYRNEDDLAGYFVSLAILQKQLQELFGGHFTLPDTFTSPAWYGAMSTPDMIPFMQQTYIGDRQDSGDPMRHEIIQEAFARHTLGMSDKQIASLRMFPSDGLDFHKAIELIEQTKRRKGSHVAIPGVGIGTKTTNITNLPAPNIVMKASKVNGIEVVKRGDGKGKQTGSEEANERLNRLIEGSIRLNHPQVLRLIRE